MGKTIIMTSAVFLMTVSWIWAGNFDALAERQDGIGAPVRLVRSDVAKSDRTPEARVSSGIRTESDLFTPAPEVALGVGEAVPTPAAAIKKRSGRGMAPPPSSTQTAKGPSPAAQSRDDGGSLELDLEKDLVISPPPAKTTEGSDLSGDSIEPKSAPKEKAVEKRQEKARPSVGVKRIAPPPVERYAAKPIRKVRPITQDGWSFPAGAYGPRPMPGIGERAACEAGAGMAQPPVRRYVRDGVTVKLAPTDPSANAGQGAQGESGDDILSAATDILGLPFAFISSLF
jgi:hypothetical protein